MQPSDLPNFELRLNELADALGNGKHITPGALKVWRDTVGECLYSDIQSVLTDWPMSHTKPPLPSEVLRACRERVSDRIERETKENSAGGWSVSRLKGDPKSPGYLAFKAATAGMSKANKPHPRAWATKLRDDAAQGFELTACQEWVLRQYRRRYEFVSAGARRVEDIEAIEERKAIQAEAT